MCSNPLARCWGGLAVAGAACRVRPQHLLDVTLDGGVCLLGYDLLKTPARSSRAAHAYCRRRWVA